MVQVCCNKMHRGIKRMIEVEGKESKGETNAWKQTMIIDLMNDEEQKTQHTMTKTRL